MDTVLLSGGGLDSTALFLYLWGNKIDFRVVHIDYGHLAFDAEAKSIIYWCAKYDMEYIPVQSDLIRDFNQDSLLFGTGANPYLNGRNAIAALIGSRFGKHIYMGLDNVAGDTYLHTSRVTGLIDANPEFLTAVNNWFKIFYFENPPKVYAPFLRMSKLDSLLFAYKLDQGLFSHSMTCWTPTEFGEECGVCKHCLLKTDLLYQVSRRTNNGQI